MRSEEGWTPSLDLGTILKVNYRYLKKVGFPYLYCITPACDTLRLKGKKRTFLFLGLLEHRDSSGKYDLVLFNDKGERIKLHIDPRPYNLRAVNFKGSSDTGRVQATKKRGTKGLFFNSETNPAESYQWIGEVRRNRANRDMAELNRAWLRFGINDSEYLRLAGKK